MAIAQRGTPTTNNTGTGTATNAAGLTVNKPTGVVSGDLIIINVGMNSGSGTTSVTGFTRVTGTVYQAQSTTIMQDVWYRVADGSEGASFTVFPSATFRMSIDCAAYSGCDPLNPFAGVNQKTAVASTTIAPGAAIPQGESVYGVLCFTSRNTTSAQTVSTPSTGYTTSANTATTNSAFIQAALLDSHTVYGTPIDSTNPGSTTISVSSNYCSTFFFLRPDASLSSAITPTVEVATFERRTITSPLTLLSYTTGYANTLHVLVIMGGAPGGSDIAASVVDSGGLTWIKRVTQDSAKGIEIWTAFAASPVTNNAVTITLNSGSANNYALYSVVGVNTTTPTGATGVNNAAVPQQIAITTTGNNSMIIGGTSTSSYGTPDQITNNTFVAGNQQTSGTSGSYSLRSTTNVATPSSFTYGVASSPGSSSNSIAVLEIMAVAAAGIPNKAYIYRQAVNRASIF